MKKHDVSRLLIFAGLLWLALGITALISPSVTYLVIVQYSGVALFLDGILWLSLCFSSDASPRESNWRMAESVIDIAFSLILLLDPLFALFAFPFLVTPWMAVKGLLKMISSLTLKRLVHGWSGDFIAGALLLLFSLLIPNDPLGKPFGISTFISTIGLTLGMLYLFDYFRNPDHRHIHFKL